MRTPLTSKTLSLASERTCVSAAWPIFWTLASASFSSLARASWAVLASGPMLPRARAAALRTTSLLSFRERSSAGTTVSTGWPIAPRQLMARRRTSRFRWPVSFSRIGTDFGPRRTKASAAAALVTVSRTFIASAIVATGSGSSRRRVSTTSPIRASSSAVLTLLRSTS